MSERPTPETDAFIATQNDEWDVEFAKLTTHAKKLERERDEAREQRDRYKRMWDELSEEQINIAIAEACGWKPETYGPSWHETETKIPNYCNDLNAMHQAEKRLTGMDRAEFAVQLCRIAGREWPNGIGGGSFIHVHATARQRVEAFLRAIGKWKEAAK